jgi:hypothetical protein
MTNESFSVSMKQSGSNPGSKTTLLSEFQMRENGIVVDSVAKTHKKDTDGNFGTQSITIDEHTVLILTVITPLFISQ